MGLVDFPTEREGERVLPVLEAGGGTRRLLPRRARRHARAHAAVTEPAGPVALVLGASADAPPPGIEAAADVLDLRFATATDELAERRAAGRTGVVLLARRTRRARAAWDAAGDLRWIQTASAGVDALLFPGLGRQRRRGHERPRRVRRADRRNGSIGAMLAFTTGLHRSIVDQQAGVWGDGRRPSGSRAGISRSWGRARSAAARPARALALGMTVTMVGRTRARRRDVRRGHRSGPASPRRSRDADFVLDALPLTPTTPSMFDAAAFAAMRPPRGSSTWVGARRWTRRALIDALRSRHASPAPRSTCSRGAAAGRQPAVDDAQVIVSPHISGDVEGWERDVVQLFAETPHRWVRGEPLVNLIDKRAGHGMA